MADKRIEIRTHGVKPIDTSTSAGRPKYVGARAEVRRVSNGVMIRLTDYAGTTEEFIAEVIQNIISNNDGSLTFVLPDGREMTTASLTGPQGPQGNTGPRGEAGPQGNQGVPGIDGQDGVDGQDGQDGVSPILTVSDITGGKRITIVDAAGTKTADLMNGNDGSDGSDGQDGQDGFSPVVAITDITGGHRVSITDAVDTYTADVMDGVKGDKGDPGIPGPTGNGIASITKTGTSGLVDTYTITFTDGTTTTFTVTNGQDGSESVTDVTVDGVSVLVGDIAVIDLSGKADVSSLPTKVSDLQNDAGYITGFTETDPLFITSAAFGIASSDITAWNNKSDFSGSYNDLTNKPTIPTSLSDLTNDLDVSDFPNDAGYLTSHQDISGKADKVDTDIDSAVTTLYASLGWTAPA